MNASDFVTALRNAAPTKQILEECDYGSAEADEFIASFECKRRPVPLGLEPYGDSFLELIDEWDLSSIEIGPICFDFKPSLSDEFLEIGMVEVDRLVYRFAVGDYALLDGDNQGIAVHEAAPSGGLLLEILVKAAQFFAKTAIDEIDVDDDEAVKEIKDECLSRLGGRRYDLFCEAIFGG